jgi:hypothetical protein
MKIGLAGLAAGLLLLAGAQGAWADPEVVVKCDGHLADGMRFARDTGWKPYPNPDRAVTITRDNGKFAIAVEGDLPYTSNLVIPLPQVGIKTFKVLRSGGNEEFHLEKDPATGKPLLKHTIRGGRDGSHVYNIRETILANCPTVSPDVMVAEPTAPGAASEK